jgi:hypothetical protein
MEVDASEFHAAYFADKIRKCPGPAADTSPKDYLQRVPLTLVGSLIDKDRHRRFGLSFPNVSRERAESHDAQSIQANITVVSCTDVPCEDTFTIAGCRRLGKGTGTGNTAVARIEPIASDMPTRNFGHNTSLLGLRERECVNYNAA